MPGYMSKIIHRFVHPTPKRPEHQPHQQVQPQYGTKVHFTEPEDKTPLIQPKDITKLQQIMGAMLYYARVVDGTLMNTLNKLALFLNTKEVEVIRNTLEEMVHPQHPTPM